MDVARILNFANRLYKTGGIDTSISKKISTELYMLVIFHIRFPWAKTCDCLIKALAS